MNSDDAPPKFPAGEFYAPGDYDSDLRDAYVELLEEAPGKLRDLVKDLTDEQLDTKYKNWTIRQIVHHLADSHVNAYIRCKWALTEDSPLIKSYDETKWSEVIDARTMPIESSLALLDGLHVRWAGMFSKLDMEQMKLTYFHPETQEDVALLDALPSYVWHSEHHTTQIKWVREKHAW